MSAKAIGAVVSAIPGTIGAVSGAAEASKSGKHQRKRLDTADKRKATKEDYVNLKNKNRYEEHERQTEYKQEVSLLGRWNNESKEYNKYKSNVDADLRKSGAISTGHFDKKGVRKDKKGKGTHTKDVYSADIDNQRADLYKKYTGHKMTTDSDNKLIGGQSWASVDTKDEAILAGERNKYQKDMAQKFQRRHGYRL